MTYQDDCFYFFVDGELDSGNVSYRVMRVVNNQKAAFVVKIIINNDAVVARSFKYWEGDIEKTVSYWSTKHTVIKNGGLRDFLIAEYSAMCERVMSIGVHTNCGVSLVGG